MSATIDADPRRVPAAATSLLAWWRPRVQSVLGARLQSVVLYGSVVLGDFSPAWSDVDVCTVVAEGVSETEAERLGAVHDEMRDRFAIGREAGWQSGQVIEGPYIPLALAGDPTAQGWCYVAGGTTRKRMQGHPISPFDRYVLAHSGVCWSGAPVTFAPPSRESLRGQTEQDLRLLGAPPEACLNWPIWLAGMMHWLARSVVFWRDGEFLSKTGALEREITAGSPFAKAYRLPLRLRGEGSAHCADHLPELRRNFEAVAPAAVAVLRELLSRPSVR